MEIRAGDCARQSLIASPLFLSVCVRQIEKPLLLLTKEIQRSTDLLLLMLKWGQSDHTFHTLVYKVCTPDSPISRIPYCIYGIHLKYYFACLDLSK